MTDEMEKALELLQYAENALNQVKNTPLNDYPYKDTYALVADISKFLKET